MPLELARQVACDCSEGAGWCCAGAAGAGKLLAAPFKKISHNGGKEMGQWLEGILAKQFLWKVLELCCPVGQPLVIVLMPSSHTGPGLILLDSPASWQGWCGWRDTDAVGGGAGKRIPGLQGSGQQVQVG